MSAGADDRLNTSTLMYKAQILYPSAHMRFENVLLTDHAARKIRKALKYIQSEGYMQKEAARLMGIPSSTLNTYFRWENIPCLENYFKLLKFSKQGNTRKDINYVYAEVIYPPEEIARRLKRLELRDTRGERNGIGYSHIARDLGVNSTVVRKALTYDRHRCGKFFMLGMFWLMRQERARGFSDSLSFYR